MLRFLHSIASVIEWTIIGWALLMATGALNPSGAAEDELVTALLRELNYKGAAPKLDWVTKNEVVLLCGCTTGALYKESHVYLTAAVDLGSLFGLSMLVHELYHHVQFVRRGPVRGCYDWIQREMEATAVQNRWLSAHDSARHALFVTGTCPKFD